MSSRDLSKRRVESKRHTVAKRRVVVLLINTNMSARVATRIRTSADSGSGTAFVLARGYTACARDISSST